MVRRQLPSRGKRGWSDGSQCGSCLWLDESRGILASAQGLGGKLVLSRVRVTSGSKGGQVRSLDVRDDASTVIIKGNRWKRGRICMVGIMINIVIIVRTCGWCETRTDHWLPGQT